MFGFSLQKLMLLAGIIAAVWYGFKLANRLKEARERDGLEAKRRSAERSAFGRNRQRTASRAEGTPPAEDMVQCPVCQAYVAARDATNCGRSDCPY